MYVELAIARIHIFFLGNIELAVSKIHIFFSG